MSDFLNEEKRKRGKEESEIHLIIYARKNVKSFLGLLLSVSDFIPTFAPVNGKTKRTESSPV